MTASVVQESPKTETASATKLVSANLTTTAGNALMAVIGIHTLTSTVSSITDPAGNNWVQLFGLNASSSSRLEVWATDNASPGSLSAQAITINFAATTFAVAQFFEISGARNTGILDVHAAAGSSGTSTAAASGTSASQTEANELAFGAITNDGGSARTYSATTFTQGTPTTSWPSSTTGNTSGTGTTNQELHTGALVITSTSGQAYSGTISTASNWVCAEWTIRNASSSPGQVTKATQAPRFIRVNPQLKAPQFTNSGAVPITTRAKQKPKPLSKPPSLFQPPFTNGGVVPIVTKATQKPKPTRTLTPRIFTPPFTNGRAVPVVTRGIQKPKPTRAIFQRLLLPSFTNGGVAPIVVKGTQKPRPLRKPPQLYTPKFTNGSAVPVLTVARQKLRPTRVHPQIVIAPSSAAVQGTPPVVTIVAQKRTPTRARLVRILQPPFTNGGIAPQVTRRTQKPRPTRSFAKLFSPPFTNGGVLPVITRGIQKPKRPEKTLPPRVITPKFTNSGVFPSVIQVIQKPRIKPLPPRSYRPPFTSSGTTPRLTTVKQKPRVKPGPPRLFAPPFTNSGRAPKVLVSPPKKPRSGILVFPKIIIAPPSVVIPGPPLTMVMWDNALVALSIWDRIVAGTDILMSDGTLIDIQTTDTALLEAISGLQGLVEIQTTLAPENEMNTYEVGNTVRASATFYSVGVIVDPATISLRVTSPIGTLTTYTYTGAQIIKDSAGNYHYDIASVTEGTWKGTWVTTTPAGTGSFEFTVVPNKS